MCPYLIIKHEEDKQFPVCEPKNEPCTLCVCGNANTFNEIENEKKN